MVRLTITMVLAGLASSAAVHADPGPKPSAAGGTIKGVVVFEGAPPERLPLQRFTDPLCAKVERLSEDIVVTDGKLKDVLVRIKTGTMVKKPTAVAPAAPAVIDQRDCMYTPRVLGVVVGQQVAIRNSDATFHNVHGTIAGAQQWNKPASPGDPQLVLDGTSHAGDVIDVVCDVHPWMHAYVVAQDNSAFAVTGADGAFELTGLPPGSYTVEAWHPTLGLRSQTVKLGKTAATAKFAFKLETK
jgi:plastocyanin